MDIKNRLKGTILFKIHKYILIEKDFIKRKFMFQSKSLVNLKNRYRGQRIFIVLTGPSLTVDDLNLIKGEYSLGVNSIVKSFEKTSWRPNFYLITDPNAYYLYKREIDSKDFDYIFFPRGEFKHDGIECVEFNSSKALWYKSLCNSRYLEVVYPSDELDKYFNDAPSVSFLGIQLAVYLGFSEIYLLGQDCNYNTDSQHSAIVAPGYQNKEDNKEDKQFGQILIEVFENYKKFYQNSSVKIYNCTRGGMLEAFERKRLEEVLFNHNS